MYFIAAARKLQKPSGPYTTDEMDQAENNLIRRAQIENFEKEMSKMQINCIENVSKSSVLFGLSPYLAENGFLRVHGRIDASNEAMSNTKRPIILPREHHVTHLIATDYHRRYHHCNHETALNEIKQKFQITRLRQLMKTIRNNCQHCKNVSAKPQPPQMSALPASRLAAFNAPFTHVGIDCFGPINVACGRKTEKRWGVLFTCLTMRAIHIEIIHSMNTMPTPKTILSDNGTNFHGTNNELHKRLLEIQGRNEVKTIQWTFNPPGAPHMGGIWKRMIGSIKKVLQAIMPKRNPSDKVLQAY